MNINRRDFGRSTIGLLALFATSTGSHADTKLAAHIPLPKADVGLVKTATRGGNSLSKLAAPLRCLYEQVTRPKTRTFFTPAQVKERFGAEAVQANPYVFIAIHLSESPAADAAAPSFKGVSVYRTIGDVVYAKTPVVALKTLCADDRVQSIDVVKPAAFPVGQEAAKARIRPHIRSRGSDNPAAFDRAGYTGKGVVVGIVDSGIDWRHNDFRNPDGTTRIRAIWDMTDNSWVKSDGKIGHKPPIDDENGAPLGTLYTDEDINAALNGTGTVNSMDHVGHGTACAGTAAGNGSATGNGQPAGQYPGVAPEADLVVVKAGEEGVSPLAAIGSAFIADVAAKLGEPCVISHSFGTHDSASDGTDPEDRVLDSVAGPGKPGVILCAAAGNEGRDAFHARARFGPAVDGQADVIADPVELIVHSKTELDVYLDHHDDWGIAIAGEDKFFIDTNGKPDIFYVNKDGSNVRGSMERPAKLPANFSAYFDTVQLRTSKDRVQDLVTIPLPPGRYSVYALGMGKEVPNGVVDYYLPFPEDASFGQGADKQFMVATPGDASNVITVGAYYFRGNWPNAGGQTTSYNLPIGDLCTYSCPGYRRDGMVKPEIIAPASFTISPLAKGCAMAHDAHGAVDTSVVLPDGVHIAWDGTSAASPYAAGVIALMLQKNPTLDEDQVRHILETTATSDNFTGTTPNPNWGYGKIDPVTAIAAVEAKTGDSTQ